MEAAAVPAHAKFLATRIESLTSGVETTTPGSSPLDGHWLSFTVEVASMVPPARRIILWQEGSLVQVIAPNAVESDLYYMYIVTCSASHPGFDEIANFNWEPLA